MSGIVEVCEDYAIAKTKAKEFQQSLLEKQKYY
jgi:hypothetical protein